MLPHICERWGGPMVVALLSEEGGEGGATQQSLWPSTANCSCSLLRLQLAARPADRAKGYPINWLRNQAIRCVATSHYLMVRRATSTPTNGPHAPPHEVRPT